MRRASVVIPPHTSAGVLALAGSSSLGLRSQGARSRVTHRPRSQTRNADTSNGDGDEACHLWQVRQAVIPGEVIMTPDSEAHAWRRSRDAEDPTPQDPLRIEGPREEANTAEVDRASDRARGASDPARGARASGRGGGRVGAGRRGARTHGRGGYPRVPRARRSHQGLGAARLALRLPLSVRNGGALARPLCHHGDGEHDPAA
jgi:hypothetical protein